MDEERVILSERLEDLRKTVNGAENSRKNNE